VNIDCIMLAGNDPCSYLFTTQYNKASTLAIFLIDLVPGNFSLPQKRGRIYALTLA